jgi:hypothetical protein
VDLEVEKIYWQISEKLAYIGKCFLKPLKLGSPLELSKHRKPTSKNFGEKFYGIQFLTTPSLGA